MALNKISQYAVNAVITRLSDPATGFNPGIATNAAIYGLPVFIQINWTSTSTNFVKAQVDPENLEKSGILTYPFICIYTKETANQNLTKFSQFSGLIRVILEVHLSYIPIRGIQDHESYGNCVEDVLYDVINRVQNQNWSSGNIPLIYNGGMRIKRNPLVWSAQNWKQALGAELIFQVDQ
jgi:hypothetical protein